MKKFDRKTYRILLVVLVLLLMAAIILLARHCRRAEQAAAGEDVAGVLVDMDGEEEREYNEEGIPPTDCSDGAELFIADGPGTPEDADVSLVPQGAPGRPGILAASPGGPDILALTVPPVKKVPLLPLSPFNPSPSEGDPSPAVKVLNPEQGRKLEAGSPLTLCWEIDSERSLKVEILFSADGGARWAVVAGDLEDQSFYMLTVPGNISDNCLFRINAWVGTALLGYNFSPVFSIVPPAPLPQDPGEPPPPLFTAEDGAFIPSEGNAVRLLKIEHDLKDVESVVWQVGRINFPCGAALPFAEAPGLLAQGELPGKMREFKIDFGALMAGVAAGEAPAANEGADFDIFDKSLAFEKSQHNLYVRAILLDKNKKAVGITRSNFKVIYGQSSLDTQTPPETPLSAGKFKMKEEPGWSPGSFKPFPEKGICLFSGYENKWIFGLGQIPGETYDLELQIATQPFAAKYQSDYLDPAGLVYRNRYRHTYIEQFFHVDFADFAPSPMELGQGTIQYFIRAVCYLDTGLPGTYVPVATPSYPICYTGDFTLYMKKQLEAIPPPPEEVKVKSFVPRTRVVRYIPPRWAFKNADEYFQVTRHIEAEEMCFYIKNNATGDFLYAYPTHMHLYPKTTRQEYQEKLDRMLPRGASFHLTIKGPSGIAKLWEEFKELLSEIYNSVQSAYNGLKVSIADFVADRCAFLGETVQGYVRQGVKALLDYGLAYVGLPPTLPNFEELSRRGLSYCVEVALQEAAEAAGVPVELIPDQVRKEITAEVNAQFDELSAMQAVNPFDVDYLRPYPGAMYRPPRVTLSFFNSDKEEWSRPGTFSIYFCSQGSLIHSLFESKTVTIPSLPPMSVQEIDVYLERGTVITAEGFRSYYDGSSRDFTDLIVVARYDVPNIEEAAKEQGLIGTDPKITYLYEYDRDPVFWFEKRTRASEPYYE